VGAILFLAPTDFILYLLLSWFSSFQAGHQTILSFLLILTEQLQIIFGQILMKDLFVMHIYLKSVNLGFSSMFGNTGRIMSLYFWLLADSISSVFYFKDEKFGTIL
jgi:hypothetical protein